MADVANSFKMNNLFTQTIQVEHRVKVGPDKLATQRNRITRLGKNATINQWADAMKYQLAQFHHFSLSRVFFI
jgi:hypothetical protein